MAGQPFSLLNDEQTSNKVRVEHQPDISWWISYCPFLCFFFQMLEVESP